MGRDLEDCVEGGYDKKTFVRRCGGPSKLASKMRLFWVRRDVIRGDSYRDYHLQAQGRRPKQGLNEHRPFPVESDGFVGRPFT